MVDPAGLMAAHPDDATVLDGYVHGVTVGVQERRRLCPAVYFVLCLRGYCISGRNLLTYSDSSRADEGTRTAHLLITSDNPRVAEVCVGLQTPHI